MAWGKLSRIQALPDLKPKSRGELGFRHFSPIFTDGRLLDLDKISGLRSSSNPDLDFCRDRGALSGSISPMPAFEDLNLSLKELKAQLDLVTRRSSN